MKESMSAILFPHLTLPNKITAFDNFEQLIENIDNANNMENLGLWAPLVGLFDSEEAEMRRYATWCAGTAVQNNVKAQEAFLATGAVERLVGLAVGDESEGVRRKAIYALSSEVRNFQRGLDEVVRALPKSVVPEGGVDAGDMEVVDRIMERLREDSGRRGGP
ncbi:MAG: hypothetical protein Q9164_005600 [Protoblastenia rupestris]